MSIFTFKEMPVFVNSPSPIYRSDSAHIMGLFYSDHPEWNIVMLQCKGYDLEKGIIKRK
jgi:hypothetical protein